MPKGRQQGVEARTPSRDCPEGEPAVDENGVDLTLVRYTLNLTPSERLLTVEKFMNALATVHPKSPRGWK
jgi:hypothetical protein